MEWGEDEGMRGRQKVSDGDLIRERAAQFSPPLLMRGLLWRGASDVCHGEAGVEEYRAWRGRQADPLRSVILHLQIPNTLKPGLV